jgi:D-xylose transport system substrate-binding protein
VKSRWNTLRRQVPGPLLVLVLLGLVLSCTPARHKADPGKAVRIGFSMDSLVIERWTRDIDAFTRAARDWGAELVLEQADQDPGIQEAQIRDLLNRNIDVLVVVPNDADKLTAVIAEVRAKGIPVLSYDRLVRNAGVDLYVSFDNEKVGYLMAQAICQAVPTGDFIIVNGPQTDNNARMLNRGIHSVLDQRVATKQIRIIDEIWPSTWDSDPVRVVLEGILSKDRGVRAIIAGNDMLAEAAIGVLSENRLITQARVSGQDADLAACQRIAEGTQYATIYKPVDRLALKAAGFAVMLARGEKIQTDSTIDDGTGKVPYVRLEPILVTRDLLDSTVIRDGYQTAADVYRNLNQQK